MFINSLSHLHNPSAIASHTLVSRKETNKPVDNQINKRVIVGIVVVFAFVLGAIGFSGISYNAGLTDGLMRGAQQPQIIVPNANGDGARVVPAPAVPTAPYFGQPYAQPYGHRPVGGWGGWGGFGIFGFLFNLLLIGGAIWLVSRFIFRRRFGGRWGGRGWGGHAGPWEKRWSDLNRDRAGNAQKGNDSPAQPKRGSDEVI